MKQILIFLLALSVKGFAQADSAKAVSEISLFQKELNEEYLDRKKSPLSPDDFAKFKGHNFYPIDLSFRVVAKLKITTGSEFFAMKTTTSTFKDHRVYGMIEFTLQGKKFSVPIYQSKNLMATVQYKDYLFFPFTDTTNGNETYDGGRYIDLRIPASGNEIIIDFNKAYNPFCAYSAGYSCPIVPAENNLDIPITVGVRYYKSN